ncbi:hydroxyisourate hydrolase [Nocardioides sp. W7]|uniref:hydroxyisourate hydrolase n=1 Tax=Nocardioides sp. W7 TaxID=2931390 RepID=UPI001FD515DF|nr:hydroxyisourate hydrolase [Nocardioides sp. W7]
MSTLSTHVLDAALGRPASGLSLALTGPDGATLATAVTDGDGRVRFDAEVGSGPHALVFETGPWFDDAERDTFFPTVELAFTVDEEQPHFHVALLLSPYSYTTYRGS